MILLIWSAQRAFECAQALERTLDQPVRVISDLDAACEELKSSVYSAVLLDHWQYDNAPAKADFVFQHLGNAAAVIVNFAISGTDRVVRTVRTSLEQRKREMIMARRQACSALNAELRDELTALSLCCGTCLQDSTLAPQTIEQLKRIKQIGKEIELKLQPEQKRETAAGAQV